MILFHFLFWNEKTEIQRGLWVVKILSTDLTFDLIIRKAFCNNAPPLPYIVLKDRICSEKSLRSFQHFVIKAFIFKVVKECVIYLCYLCYLFIYVIYLCYLFIYLWLFEYLLDLYLYPVSQIPTITTKDEQTYSHMSYEQNLIFSSWYVYCVCNFYCNIRSWI